MIDIRKLLGLPTVKEIRAGNYCVDCDISCIHFEFESDCCVCDTCVERLYTQLHPECLQKELKFEKRV